MSTMAERPTICPFDTPAMKHQFPNATDPPSTSTPNIQYEIISPPEAFSQYKEKQCPLDNHQYVRQLSNHEDRPIHSRQESSDGQGRLTHQESNDSNRCHSQKSLSNDHGRFRHQESNESNGRYSQQSLSGEQRRLNHQESNDGHGRHNQQDSFGVQDYQESSNHGHQQSPSTHGHNNFHESSSDHRLQNSQQFQENPEQRTNSIPQMNDQLPVHNPVPNFDSSIPEFPESEGTVTLLPCTICNRTFSPTALARHRKVCEKLQTKRKTSISSGRQTPDPREIKHQESKKSKEKSKKSKWREKHQEFLRAIRAARGSGKDEDGSDNGPIIPLDYIKCPHCDRHFGPKAADRHIEWCKEQSSRMGRGSIVDTAAVERLKSRTKYTPPKPGQSGWRAPKKKDVISSIPPPSSGPHPASRLGSPPAPALPRHLSPPPMSPSRRGSVASTGSIGSPQLLRSGSMSLGRSAGKQFSAYLQSITGNHPGYGSSSGYGQGIARRDSNASQSGFSRTGSLRVPNSPKPVRRSSRMARRRDLVSDMMASVCLDNKSKRGEPEGDEDKPDMQRHMMDEIPYDPFSAAELQFQVLLDTSGGGGGSLGAAGLGSGMMGSTGSLKYVGLGRDTGESLLMKNRNKPRNKNNLSTLSLTSIGLDSSDFLSKQYSSPEVRRRSRYTRSPEGHSKFYNDDDTASVKSEAPSTIWSWTGSPSLSRKSSAFRSPIIFDPPFDEPESPASVRKPSWGSSVTSSPFPNRKTSWETTSSYRSTSPNRKHSWDTSPPQSPTFSSRKTSWESPNPSPDISPNRSPSRSPTRSPIRSFSPTNRKSPFGSPPPRSYSPLQKPLGDGSSWNEKEEKTSPKPEKKSLFSTPTSIPSFSPRRLFSSSLGSSSNSNSGWTNNSGISKTFSRHFGGRQSVGDNSTSANSSISNRSPTSSYPFESLRTLSKSLETENAASKKDFASLDDQQQRVSSGSSTDSSLPPLSSPASSSSPLDRKVSGGEEANTSALRLPRFCHECGHKYPVLLAKFCCQCGSKRPSLDQ